LELPADRRSPFGQWLDGMLKARGLNRHDFGRQIGVDPAMVSKWTIDRTPRPPACRQIADGLGIPLAEVLSMAGHLESTTEVDNRHPTRARLHELIDRLDPELLEPHLEILETTARLLNVGRTSE
jgi:transcriptional regulator with XRE-family HTH domain